MTSETDHERAEAPPGGASAELTPRGVQGAAQAATQGLDPEVPRTPEQLMQAASARIAALEAEIAELRERWMRAEAETQNVRTRARREADETRQYAVQKFASDVVEAAENLRRGLDALPAPERGEPEIITKMRDGFAGVERGFLAILERNGVKREDPTGTPFDPNLHQAMGEQESTAQAPGTVLQAWTQAWTLNGRLLRPAMVVVAKAPPSGAPPNGAPPNGAPPSGASPERAA